MFKNRQSGAWAILEAHLPSRSALAIGIILVEHGCDQLHVKFRRNWWQSLSGVDRSVCENLEEDLTEKAQNYKASEILPWLSEASHAIRLSPLRRISIQNAEVDLESIYSRIIAEPTGSVLRSIAHRPTPGPAEHARLLSNMEFGLLPFAASENSGPYARLFSELDLPNVHPAVRKRSRRQQTKRKVANLPLRMPVMARSQTPATELHPPDIAIGPNAPYSALLSLPLPRAAPYKSSSNVFLRSLARLTAPFKFLRGKRKSA